MNQKLSITLPAETLDAINARVDTGTYASASEVVQAAMRALAEQDDDYQARIVEHDLAEARTSQAGRDATRRAAPGAFLAVILGEE